MPGKIADFHGRETDKSKAFVVHKIPLEFIDMPKADGIKIENKHI